MPTGYTADIYDGKDISFEKFVLQCARAFGAVIHMRDDSMHKRLKGAANQARSLSCIHSTHSERLIHDSLGLQWSERMSLSYGERDN